MSLSVDAGGIDQGCSQTGAPDENTVQQWGSDHHEWVRNKPLHSGTKVLWMPQRWPRPLVVSLHCSHTELMSAIIPTYLFLSILLLYYILVGAKKWGGGDECGYGVSYLYLYKASSTVLASRDSSLNACVVNDCDNIPNSRYRCMAYQFML